MRVFWIAFLVLVFELAAVPARAEGDIAICRDSLTAGLPVYTDPSPATMVCQRSSDGTTPFFLIRYNTASRTPDWVAYRLTTAQMTAVAASELGRLSRFRPNPDFPEPGFRQPRHDDYTNSGFDRGHNAPSKTFTWAEEAWRDTYWTTNIAPQNPDMNRKIWKCLEASVRDWAKRYGELEVFTGVFFAGQEPRIGGQVRIAVPSHFWKVVYRPRRAAIAFLIPNATGYRDLRLMARPLRSLERLIGIDFLTGLPPASQDAIELAPLDLTAWPLKNPKGASCVAVAPSLAERVD
jgi:endonuclease G